MTVTVAVISGGVSQPSTTRLLADRLADATRRAAGGRGGEVAVVTIELRSLAREITDALLTGFPGPTLSDALEAVAAADAVIAVTPVFRGSYSGLFKSFFDVLDPQALAGKPAVLAATGGSARHSLVLDHALRPLFASLAALVVPTGVFAATADFGAADAEQAGRSLADRIDRAARELVALLRSAGPAHETSSTYGALMPGPHVEPNRQRRDTDPFDALVPFEELLARA